jgi:hypothetical protein
MNSALSVNEALDRLPELAGQHISVVGILEFEYECSAISHFPKKERVERSPWVYGSSIWLTSGSGSVSLNPEVLSKWSGHRVQVMGVLQGPGAFGGRGHMSLWPAQVEALSIERV